MKVYYDKDADLSLIKGKKVTIVGYGSQGHAHAQNLSDSGVKVTVGLRKGGASWKKAEAAGLKVEEIAKAVKGADVVMILLPDENIPQVYNEEVAPNLKKGAALAFAQVRLDVVPVDGGDLLVGQQDHHDVGGLHRLGDLGDLQAGLLSLGPAGAALAQTDGDLDAAVVEVLRVGMALRAIADDGDVLALDQAQVGVFVVVNLHASLR